MSKRPTKRLRQVPPKRVRLNSAAFAPDRFNPDLSPEQRRDQRRESVKRSTLPQLKAQFSQTSDPLMAWSAFFEARNAGVSIPDWVLDYFNAVWMNLMSLKSRPPGEKEIAQAIADAVGFRRGGVGRTSLLRQYEDPRAVSGQKKRGAYNPFKVPDQFALAFGVYAAILDGHKLLYAYVETAKRHKVSKRTVEYAWSAYREYFPLKTSHATK